MTWAQKMKAPAILATRKMPTRKKGKEAHPFFCHVKGVRKSAWATPEYMTDADWMLAEAAVKATSAEEFRSVVFMQPDLADVFFNRIIGWPEGRHYMRDIVYAEKTGWPSLVRHEWPRLTAAVAGKGICSVPLDCPPQEIYNA